MALRETFRMTIDLPVDDHKKLKMMSAMHGKPMRNIIVEALSEFYKNQPHTSKPNAKKPTAETRKALKEIKCDDGLIECGSVDDFFKKFGV